MRLTTTRAVYAGVFAFAFAAFPAKAQTSPPDAQPSIQVVHTVAPAARKTVTGIFTIETVLTVNKNLPNGTMINFTCYTSVSDAAFSNTHSVSAAGKVTGGKVNVTLTVPYTFLVSTTADKVSFYLQANAGTFTSEPTYNFSVNFQSMVPLPANGAATTVKYSGSI